MPSVRFNLNWKLTLFTAFFLPILISLGFWQLNRAQEKITILENWASQQDQAAIPIEKLSPSLLHYQPEVNFEGRFDTDHYWLQEGITLQGRVGYLVLMRVITTTGQNVLVNRGWVAADLDRNILPEISSSDALQSFQGRARSPSAAPMTQESHNPIERWPHRILEIELELMGQQARTTFSPFVVDLSADHPSSFHVIPRKLNASPEKHRGYAFQWFMMAATLVILWLITNTNLMSVIGKKTSTSKHTPSNNDSSN